MAKIIDFNKKSIELNKEEQAQEIIYDAWESDSIVQRKRLARKALEIDPLCIDAYSILAITSESNEKKLEFYKKGVDAFLKKHDKNYFNENKGYFWGLVETRPYMRACAGYGQALWDSGLLDGAIDQFKYLIDLNKNDNQGIRYTLVNWLLYKDDLEKTEELLKEYPEKSSFMLFSKLLLSIKQDPNNEEKIIKDLKVAQKANKYILKYFLFEKDLPNKVPNSYSIGSEDEAIIYCSESLKTWINDKNAINILNNDFPIFNTI